METSLLDSLVDIATQAAQCAGDYALSVMDQAVASVKQGTTGEELVTQVDKQSQDKVIETIRSRFPDHGFIGEEGGGDGQIFKIPSTGEERIWWIIDPIDGTNNFARGMDLFAVSVGAVYNGLPVAGVIYHPAGKTIFSAHQDGPALLNGQPIQSGNDSIGLFSSVALDSHFGDCIPPWLQDIIINTRFRALGSAALHMAYVSNGAFVGALIGTPKLWDIAAGAIIAQQSGAILTDWNGQAIWPLDMDNYQGEKLPCLVANPTAHREIMELIKS